MTKLPKAPMRKILGDVGAEYASHRAVSEMRKCVEDFAYALAEASVACSKHAGRKTVKIEDVKLAMK